MNLSRLFVFIVYSVIIIRFIIITFKIITDSKKINFFIFTPTIINENNRIYLLLYSLAIIIISFLVIICYIIFNSYLWMLFSIIAFIITLYNAEKHTI